MQNPIPAIRSQRGITLLELMIVVVIIAIIASIGYPSYMRYVVNTKRTAATSTLLQVADRQQQFFMDNKRFAADLIRQGAIGKVHTVLARQYKAPKRYGNLPQEPIPNGLDWQLWSGPAPLRPYNHWLHLKMDNYQGWAQWRDYSGGDVTLHGAHAADQILDLETQFFAQFGVQVAQRLVEQEHLGVAHDGAAHRHALALTAGKLGRLAVQQVFDLQDGRHALDAFFDFSLGDLACFQSKGEIAAYVHVGIERVRLEHHGDIPVLGRNVVDYPIAHADLARGDRFQARNQVEQRRFTASRRPYQDQELAGLDGDVDALEDPDAAESFGDIVDDQ